MASPPEQSLIQLTELKKAQRRVLGTLIEKGLTTPDQYPLTLKACTTGCNQKNNRDPVTSYSEEQVADTLDELREMGLVAEVHTESGRTARYRHYMRHRTNLSEPQLAILTELLLRGRQTLGELRTRASRMVPIDSLDQLREEVQQLIDQNYVQANGSLERRGVEVDHNLYQPSENRTLAPGVFSEDEPAASAAAVPPPLQPSPILTNLEEAVAQLQEENRALREEIDTLQEQFRDLAEQFEQLKQDLGG